MDLIYTIEARCRDCYKCVRHCPVKAIRIKGVSGSEALRAEVLKERCVHDGSCISVCPQQAKKVRGDAGRIKDLIRSGQKVVASLAPSFAASFPVEKPGLVIAGLRKLGFAGVQETACGAELVARAYKQLPDRGPIISSACPAVVSLVEKHFPELLACLPPIVSPMIAHGKIIKSLHPDAAVVFIGPCLAKKYEAEEPQFRGVIDAVLDFGETWEWLQRDIADLAAAAKEFDDDFDGPRADAGRLFPLDGGMLKTAGLSTDMLDGNVLAITGLINCMDFLQHLLEGGGRLRTGVVELLACPGGCIGGPLSVSKDDLFIKKQRILDYYRQGRSSGKSTGELNFPGLDLRRDYSDKCVRLPRPTDEEINEILARIGKTRPEDMLNCGSCGYPTCRDKAVAVYHGIADLKMCIPYMRERAESVSSRVISAMPNGIVIVNRDMQIMEINDVAREMLGIICDDLRGRDLALIMDPSNFRQVAAAGIPLNLEMSYEKRGLFTREMIFPLTSEEMVVGILMDITEEKKQQEQHDLLRNETIARAQEVIAKQMQVAQEIAGLLGETTADTKVLLTKLIRLVKDN